MIELKIKDSSEKVKVNNIFCIGKNYLDHIHEFAKPEVPTEPVVFMKPNTSIVQEGGKVFIPEVDGKFISQDLQNEVEIVLVIGKDCYQVKEKNALDYIKGYAIGLDLTLRDLQAYEKSKGLPWTVAKGFYSACAVSEIIPSSAIDDVKNINFNLEKNGEVIQTGNSSAMIFNIPRIISYLSQVFKLVDGDLIFTGTPSGISTLFSGDKLKAQLENLLELNIEVK